MLWRKGAVGSLHLLLLHHSGASSREMAGVHDFVAPDGSAHQR